MQATDFQTDVTSVAQCGPIRVWSLVVTVLGDLCQSRDDYLSGRTLNQIVSHLGINNQALRVALHRLRRDGWIRTERDGRTSNYFLSDQGREMTLSVRDQIYGTVPRANQAAWVLIGPPHLSATDFTDLLPDDAVAVASRIAIIQGDGPAPDDCLQLPLQPQAVPGWVSDILVPPELRVEYTALTSALTEVLAHPTPSDLLERTALRLVTLHHWRRLRLRHSTLADEYLPPDWPGVQARHKVMEALERYERPAIPSLEAHVARH